MKLLKFYADWCGPCKTLGPIVDNLVNSYEYLDYEAIDVGSDSSKAEKYGVKAIPYLVLLDDEGKMIKAKAGLMTAEELEEWVLN